ncbi:hypothetical protein SAMN05216371_6927 [Streptomyces sp. TLI_053]|uniref:hypothetical protein n=1 Tax=Streptomyces sp. TLI_053 TaxID=1855352 RepID=UPI00087D5FEB|nr:hypothetical protein [Streptomyces sp. TLI_053]SDT82008.1 hypothetical protein SAMN05216371_6927 [Streptomyces sp. TLI_053]
MTALVRYRLTTLLLSQRYLAPLLLFTALVTVLTSNDTGPLTATHAASGLAMLLAATWLTTALAGLEDPTHRAVVTAAAGGHRRLATGTVLAALVVCLPLTVLGLVLPLLVGTHDPTPADLLLGAEAQLTCGCTGAAVGLLAARPVVRRQGYGLLLALVLLLVLTLGKGLPPVNLLLTRLSGHHRSAELVGSTGLLLALAAALLGAAAVVAHAVAVRRD